MGLRSPVLGEYIYIGHDQPLPYTPIRSQERVTFCGKHRRQLEELTNVTWKD